MAMIFLTAPTARTFEVETHDTTSVYSSAFDEYYIRRRHVGETIVSEFNLLLEFLYISISC